MQQYVVLHTAQREKIKNIFIRCHKIIWNSEKRNPYSAFVECIKLLFIKLQNDQHLHEQYTVQDGVLRVRENDNRFSQVWIQRTISSGTKDPVNDILFFELLQKQNDGESIFSAADRVHLNPATIMNLAGELECYDLFHVDEDMPGKLFEIFLDALMRGSVLGQYFTPQSIVYLATELADPHINAEHVDRVIDTCCGSGGFLIAALKHMRTKIWQEPQWDDAKKEHYLEHIAKHCIYGMDVAQEPALYKIARMNMALHSGQLGNIFYGDALEQHASLPDGSFDVVLSNPPFSMRYGGTDPTHGHVLKQYALAQKETQKGSIVRGRVRAVILFIERYYTLLKPGGRLLTLIDDTVLESEDMGYVRDFIREHFIVRAVISLPGDAFRMANARVKTSLLFLQKKNRTASCDSQHHQDIQGDVFMFPAMYLGLDDLPTQSKTRIGQRREETAEEIEYILREHQNFVHGNHSDYSVSASDIQSRLDVKFCAYKKTIWQGNTAQVQDILSLCNDHISPHADEVYSFLKIHYNGRCSLQCSSKGRDIPDKKLTCLQEGDLVFSMYNALHGAIAYITKEFAGYVVTTNYFVTRTQHQHDALYLWQLLRKTDFRMLVLVDAVGIGRKTVSWNTIKNITVPFISVAERKAMASAIIELWEKEQQWKDDVRSWEKNIDERFGLESEYVRRAFHSMKPPR